MDTFSYFINFCQRIVEALASLVDPLLRFCERSLCDTLRLLTDYTWFPDIWERVVEFLEKTEFGNSPLIFALFGSGFIIYLVYAVIKWVLDIIL